MSRSQVAGWVGLGLVVALALGIRLWYVTALPGQGKDLIFSDMWAYDYTAWQLVRGEPVTGEPGLNGYHPLSASTYYYAGYMYFVAAVYSVFGHSLGALRVTQAVVGALTAGSAFVLGRLVFGARAGVLAAALTAVYLPLVYYAGLLLTETWYTFAQLVSVTLWLRAWVRGPGPGSGEPGAPPPGGPASLAAGAALALAAGVVGGLACLTRPLYVISLGTLTAGGWLFPPAPAGGRGRAIRIGAFLLGAAAAIAPVTIRNYQIHKRFFLITTNSSSTFLTGHVTHNTDLPPDAIRARNDAELSDRHRKQSFRYLAEHWRVYLDEIPEFYEIIWTDNDFWPYTMNYWSLAPPDRTRPRPSTRAHPGYGRIDVQARMTGSPPFGRLSYFPDLIRYNDRVVWGVVGLPMGLLAALFLPRSDRRWTVLYLAILPFLAIPFLASPFSRYRLPACPLVFVLAGHALATCWSLRARAADRAPLGSFSKLGARESPSS